MQTPQERADKLSRFRPEARQPLLGLLSTPNFKSQNLMKLDEADYFFLACSTGAGENRFQCALSEDGASVCGATFDRRDRFADHLHRHLDMKPYQCRCNVAPCIPAMEFATRALLDNHYTGNKKTECEYCTQVIVTKNKSRHQNTSILCLTAQETTQSSSTA
ncbi:hypothetical protein CPB86DRAFT_810588 [Serendipita vermifera]|nr:hypothetical protein CPB86DRAFT_810588 [Serendipita vermifera]